MIADPESFPDTYSIPVPTIGASGSRSGTACRCMLAPISARLETSYSMNGMQAVAAETTCFCDTSTQSVFTVCEDLFWRHVHIIYFFTRNSRVFPAEPSNNFFVYKATFLIKPCVRLCYDIVVLFIRSQIVSLVGDLACVWINAAVRCFNKAELIDF